MAKKDMVSRIMAYEAGEMTEENDVVELFQDLVDSGLAWQLQGSYGRTAKAFINEGYVTFGQPKAEEVALDNA